MFLILVLGLPFHWDWSFFVLFPKQQQWPWHGMSVQSLMPSTLPLSNGFPRWILLNVRALCCVASCSTCARAYRSLPSYNGRVVFKAKLSVVSLQQEILRQPLQLGRNAMFVLQLLSQQSPLSESVATLAFFFFNLNTSVLAKGFTTEPKNKIKQMRHLFIL